MLNNMQWACGSVSKFNLYNSMPICKELISYCGREDNPGGGAIQEAGAGAGRSQRNGRFYTIQRTGGVAAVWHFNWIKWRPELVFELTIGICLILWWRTGKNGL